MNVTSRICSDRMANQSWNCPAEEQKWSENGQWPAVILHTARRLYRYSNTNLLDFLSNLRIDFSYWPSSINKIKIICRKNFYVCMQVNLIYTLTHILHTSVQQVFCQAEMKPGLHNYTLHSSFLLVHIQVRCRLQNSPRFQTSQIIIGYGLSCHIIVTDFFKAKWADNGPYYITELFLSET